MPIQIPSHTGSDIAMLWNPRAASTIYPATKGYLAIVNAVSIMASPLLKTNKVQTIKGSGKTVIITQTYLLYLFSLFISLHSILLIHNNFNFKESFIIKTELAIE